MARVWKRAAPQGVYNVGGGSQVDVLEAIQMLENHLGTKAIVKLEPRPPGDPMRTRADATRIRADLDFVPATPIDFGLGAEAAWARSVYAGAKA